MSHHIIEFDSECKSCGGTGLYVGMAEQKGCAVVCHTCKGKGKVHTKIEYDDFEKLKIRENVQHVIETNPGIGVGENNNLKFSDFGGMSYDQWLKTGGIFPNCVEMRKFTCPAWWYQNADYSKKPEWEECLSALGRTFSNCERFCNKEECWKKFDKENYIVVTRNKHES